MIEKVQIVLTVVQGSELAPKDRNFLGKRTSSDPYVEIWSNNKNMAKTKTKFKTLNPVWNESFTLDFSKKPSSSSHQEYIVLKIWDHDSLSRPDAMGEVGLLIDCSKPRDEYSEWIEIPPGSAKNAKGRILVKLSVQLFRSQALVRGNVFPLETNQLRIGLAWDLRNGRDNVDLDVSCVALTNSGSVSMADTVYYANESNSNGSVLHSGDEKEGDEEGDDETISLSLSRIPPHILAMYIVLTVATPGMRIRDIKSAAIRVYDSARGITLCAFSPALNTRSQDATAMFMVRIARNQDQQSHCGWILTPIEDTHPTARDFGSLIPYMKSYTRDLNPSIHVDPTERIAICRKGGNIRIKDYCRGGKLPDLITFGLAWDVTSDKDIDLDASVICFDKGLNLIDKIWFRKLVSDDQSILHHGDEREGDELGDDEKIDIDLTRISELIEYVGFLVNSYSGEELDDVDKAVCHLFDPKTMNDMALYAMTNDRSVDGHTALLVACLYRGGGTWHLQIISHPTLGRTVTQNVSDFRCYLRKSPPHATMQEEEEEIVVEAAMPSFVALQPDDEIDLSVPVAPESALSLS
mmetsp:Transcript_1791/g.3601  ORF Transcript_1791/g.3601 Transcript_1791/m.3601 type:complete len:579 (+) Transcript_1791:109-1845(+)